MLVVKFKRELKSHVPKTSAQTWSVKQTDAARSKTDSDRVTKTHG
jgi:hypothetical protein